MDGDFQSERELTQRDRLAMIRAGHRRWLAAQERVEFVATMVGARRVTAFDPIDELADLFEGFAE